MEFKEDKTFTEHRRTLIRREEFLNLYAPAAERLNRFFARRSQPRPHKNSYDLLFGVLRRLHLRISLRSRIFSGQSMHVVLPEFGSCTIMENSMLDLQTPVYCAAVLREGDVFFDGGANLGFYSLLAQLLVGNAGGIHAFEPAAFAFSILQKNLRHCQNATPVQAAVSSSDGTLKFANFGTIAGGFNRVATTGNTASKADIVPVRCLRFDTYCAEISKTPDLVKLDVEGHELAALQGLERTIALAQPFIILEYGMAEVDNLAASRFLVDRGYRPLIAENCALRFTSLEQIGASAPGENYLFAAPCRIDRLTEWMR